MEKYILGGYTRNNNKGLNIVYFDPKTQTLSTPQLLKKMKYPTFLSYIESKNILISIDKNKSGQGGISLLKYSDKLEIIDSVIDSKVPGCHIYFDSINSDIYVSQYHLSQLDIYHFNQKEMSLTRKGMISRKGESIRPEQTKSRPHCTLIIKDYLYICDLGTDHLAKYDSNYKLIEELKFPAGTGPRHLCYSEKYNQIYVVGELNNTLNVIKIDSNNKKLYIKNVFYLLDNQNDAHSAAIKLTKDERYIYLSTRYHDLINVFKVNEHGEVSPIQRVKSGGLTPRDFTLNKTEEYLLVPNMDSNSISIFERNKNNGKIKLLTNNSFAPECSRIIGI